VTGTAGTAVVVLSIALFCARRPATATWLCAVQGFLAAVSLADVGVADAVLAFVLNGIALPVAIARTASTVMPGARGNDRLAWAVVLVVPMVTFVGFRGFGLVASGISVVLLGLALTVLRPNALVAAVGVLSSQNGLVLVGGARPDLPLSAALAVAIPILPALLLADHWLRR
jgi:hypothetical protein